MLMSRCQPNGLPQFECIGELYIATTNYTLVIKPNNYNNCKILKICKTLFYWHCFRYNDSKNLLLPKSENAIFWSSSTAARRVLYQALLEI